MKNLINDGIELGVEAFTISGGEPLLYPDLKELISYIRGKGLKFSLYTCGVVKDSEGSLSPITDELLEFIVQAKPEKLIFSLQGGSQEIHEKVSGLLGSFSLTLKSIEKAMLHGINVELHFVPMSINKQDIKKVVQLADRLKISRISLLRLVPQGRVDDYLVLSPCEGVEIKEIVSHLKLEFPKVSIRLGSPFTCVSLAGNFCSAAKNKLLISATGEIYPCEAFKWLRGMRPKIYDNKIKDVWNNDELLNKIRALGNEEVANCTTCNLYELCNGGCPGQRMLANGDVLIGPDPWCNRMSDNAEETHVQFCASFNTNTAFLVLAAVIFTALFFARKFGNEMSKFVIYFFGIVIMFIAYLCQVLPANKDLISILGIRSEVVYLLILTMFLWMVSYQILRKVKSIYDTRAEERDKRELDYTEWSFVKIAQQVSFTMFFAGVVILIGLTFRALWGK